LPLSIGKLLVGRRAAGDPLIVNSALRLRKARPWCEAVVLGPDGISDFEALHAEAQCGGEAVRL
jgi:hypothetical protein